MNLTELNKKLAVGADGGDDPGREANKLEAVFHGRVASLPGRGGGLHSALLAACNIGIMAGLSDSAILAALRLSPASANFRRGEAEQQLAYARKTGVTEVDQTKQYQPKYQPKSIEKKFDPGKLAKFITHQGDMKDIELLSPWRVSADNDMAGYELLDALYNDNEYLFIGDNYGTEVKTVAEWKDDPKTQSYPLFIPNPLSGLEHETVMGNTSKRCDKAVKEGRFAVIEMDEVPLDTQVNFWLTMLKAGMPIAAITFSGTKSIHGLLRVDCPMDEWKKKVGETLFGEYLIVLGVDMMCRNLARLSRFPGHVRDGKSVQRLLYLRMDKFK